MILGLIGCISVLINVILIIVLTSKEEPTFDGCTSVTLRLAENKYLSDRDKFDTVLALIRDIDLTKVNPGAKNVLKNRL